MCRYRAASNRLSASPVAARRLAMPIPLRIMRRSRRVLVSCSFRRPQLCVLRNEIDGGFDDSLRLVALRRVATPLQLQQPRMRDVSRDTIHLRHGAVFVILALHYQKRLGDCVQQAFDVPVAKGWVEPNVVPSPESRIWIIVIAGKLNPQARALRISSCEVGLAGASNAFD